MKKIADIKEYQNSTSKYYQIIIKKLIIKHVNL